MATSKKKHANLKPVIPENKTEEGFLILCQTMFRHDPALANKMLGELMGKAIAKKEEEIGKRKK